MSYELIKEFVFQGVRFSYESYDHKAAVAELKKANTKYEDFYGVPDEIKLNHIVWRTGKLRLVYFDKNGEMCRFKIGQRWAKNFYLPDFGVRVKPMIFKSEDALDLIGQGLAVEETL
jgi:hypothetical protein